MKNPVMRHGGGIPDAVSALDSTVKDGTPSLRADSLGVRSWRSAPRGAPTLTAVLDGLGVALPPRIKHNNDFPASLDTSDEWIRSRTGIIERRIADPEVACSDLAVEAAQAAIKRSRSGNVRAVVVATTTPDHPMPGVAPIVAERLGLDTAAAFDVQAACSGFIYALAAGAGLIAAGIAEHVP